MHGNLGYSYYSGESVDTMLKQDLPPTISLVIGGMILWLIVGLAVGIISATRARSVFDRVSSIGVLIGLSMPAFVIGELLIGYVFQPLYSHGFTFFNTGYAGITSGIGPFFGHMILPWITLAHDPGRGLHPALPRPAARDAGRGLHPHRPLQGPVGAAGDLPPRRPGGPHPGALPARRRHRQLLGGVVVVETVFGLGGIGQVSVEAVDQDNLPVILGFVILAAVFVVIANIVVDLLYAALDPRVRIT